MPPVAEEEESREKKGTGTTNQTVDQDCRRRPAVLSKPMLSSRWRSKVFRKRRKCRRSPRRCRSQRGWRTSASGGSLPFPIRCWRSALPSSSTVPGRPRDRRHQWRWPKMLCAISRPIPQPNPCTTDVIKPAPCSGAKTAIAPTAKPARTIILTTMLLEIEAEETDRRGRRERAVRRRNMFAAPSPAAAAARSPRRPR